MNEVTLKHLDEMEAHEGPRDSLKHILAGKSLGVRGWDMEITRMPPNWPDFPEEDHSDDGREEVYMVLEGDAILQTPEGAKSLDPHVLVRVSPGVRRKIIPGDVGAMLLTISGKA